MELWLGEVARDVVGYEGRYAVTSFGRVWCYPNGKRKGKWFKFNRTIANYLQVGLCAKGEKRKFYYVHQLVAKAFMPNSENKKQVNHINGDRYDCRLSNLEWVTAKENIQHAIKMGLNKHPVLSYAQKFGICEHRVNGNHTVKEIAALYGVGVTCVYKAIKEYMQDYLLSIALAA
uniref:HNH endonuclease n=1 Tax=Geobacter sp. (strain M21) TaxID=443144 RepID=C6E4X8_GEOSM